MPSARVPAQDWLKLLLDEPQRPSIESQPQVTNKNKSKKKRKEIKRHPTTTQAGFLTASLSRTMATLASKPAAMAGLAPLRISAAASPKNPESPAASPVSALPSPTGFASAASTPTPAAPSPYPASNAPTPHSTTTPNSRSRTTQHHQTQQPQSLSSSSSSPPHDGQPQPRLHGLPPPTPPPPQHYHHQHQQQQQQQQQQQPLQQSQRIVIQPAPARKSLPTSSLAPAAHTSAGPPAASSPIDKMSMASVISPMPGPPAAKAPISMTSKEWVIPPRPKPGRKPATDTPPTKRKAQNRAAQRAFRERRAARVGELEEQLEAEKDEHDAAQRTLQDKVHRLELDAQALQSRCEVLENMLDKERAERAKEVEVLKMRLHQATQDQHPRQQSLPSLASVPHQHQHQHQHQQHLPLAPQPLRYHRPSASSRPYNGRASTSSLTSLTPDATHRPATTNSFSISQIISPPEDIEQAPTGCGNCEPTGPCACADDALTSVTIGCGNCTLGSRCQCLEEVLNGADHITASRSESLSSAKRVTSRTAKRTIRSISPSSMAPDEKRPRSSVTLATEIDFTAIFSRKPQPSTSSAMSQAQLPAPAAMNAAPTPQTSTSSASYSLATLAPIEPHAIESPRPEDRCGFCEDGTYCVCAEAAANNAAAAAQTESITLPSIHSTAFSAMRPSQQIRTPPPSEGDAIGYEILPDGSVKLPSLKGLHPRNKPAPDTLPRPTGGCGPGGPGTCAQCLSDPKSGLFCRSLAANFGKGGGGGGGGCCGGGGPGGGRCKDKPSASSASNTNTSLSKPSLGLSLSCADAYKTLASHKHFSEAADDINTWLPLLRAAPKPREPIIGKDGNSRTPIEVEAASIMGVLKGFDVRFGRGE